MVRWKQNLLVAVVLCLLAGPALAQADKPLPHVLIIGDGIYSQHTRDVSKLLKDKAQVVHAIWNPEEVADTATTIELLDRHLGRIDRNGKPVDEAKWPKWDLIHFNCGLGDLLHRMPGLKQFRVLPYTAGGVVNTPVEQYAKNLETLVQALKAKAPKAKLVWGSTTPIRASSSQVFKKGMEIEYNAAAATVMARHRVATNDMYTFTKHLINMDKPAGHGADPFHFDKKPIHMPIVREIERVFGLAPVPESEEEKAVKEAKAKPAPAQG